ncbi:MAG: hypothetical protein KJT03_03565, partial [Verrucomicrobiae bacterium]|nr:hypothetical protein [Verrucomicrobiae bacterium]
KLVARYLFSDKMVPEEFARLAERIAFDLKLLRIRAITTRLINKFKRQKSLPQPGVAAESIIEPHESETVR